MFVADRPLMSSFFLFTAVCILNLTPKVRLQCVETPGSVVVAPIEGEGAGVEKKMVVVEFRTVALTGEILLEAEGM